MKINVCRRSSDPFYVVRSYIKWVTTSWTYSILIQKENLVLNSLIPWLQAVRLIPRHPIEGIWITLGTFKNVISWN